MRRRGPAQGIGRERIDHRRAVRRGQKGRLGRACVGREAAGAVGREAASAVGREAASAIEVPKHADSALAGLDS